MDNSKDHSLVTQHVELPIAGGEYTLTPFLKSDISAMQSILSRGEVSNPLIAVPKPYRLSDAEFWVNSQVPLAEKLFSITSVEERCKMLFSQEFGMPIQAIRHKGTFVGCCTLTPTKVEGKVELGYYLHPEHHRKGIMKVAAREVLRLGKTEWGVKRVFSCADWENVASQKVIGAVVLEEGMSNVVRGQKTLSWPKGKYGDEKCDRLSETWEWDLV